MEAYRLPANDVLASLGRTDGLTPEEVEERRQQYGRNVLPKQHTTNFLQLFARQFTGFLVWLLLGIGLFSLGFGLRLNAQEQIVDATIIFLIVVINAVLGAYQDYKSERFSETLAGRLETRARAQRANDTVSLDASELVPGDIIHLEEGDQVPADARIIRSNRFTVDESSLTGESDPSKKHVKVIGDEVPLAERSNMIYRSTFVRTGTATCVVTATGAQTEIGSLVRDTRVKTRSRFLVEVDTAARQITRIALPLIAVALVVFYVQNGSWIDLVMLGSALIIGSIPEGLPAIVTFSLSLSSLELSKKGTLVKRKATLETLGSIDVLCTDKTGTLTENRMSVTDLHTFAGSDLNALPERLFEELRVASLTANEARRSSLGFIGGPEDTALIDFYNHHDTDIIAVREANPVDRLEPFSSEERLMSATLTDGRVYAKGAPETMLADVTHLLVSKKMKLTAHKREEVERFIAERSAEGKRLITLVRMDGIPTYLATIALEDPPKPDAAETIRRLVSAGIEVKMITGDSLDTAQSIARECGFPHIEGITWNELKDLSEPEFLEAVERCSIFARMSPSDKVTIVRALRANEHVVGITGDGVNDVPALREADIGIAMENASDIAKDAADLILLDGNLTHVLEGVRSGRTVFDNMRKVINYLLTANLSEIIVVFLASIFGLVPFTAIQLLWVNFVTDIGPALALGADPAHPNVLTRKPTGSSETLIDRRILLHTVFIGLKKVVFLLVVFLITYELTADLRFAQTITFTWLVLSHVARIVAIRVDEKLSILANPWLFAAMIAPIALQLVILYTPLAGFFQIDPVPALWWLFLVGFTLLSIAAAGVISSVINRYTGGFIVDREPL